MLPDRSGQPCPLLKKLSVSESPVDLKSNAAEVVYPDLREWSARVWTFPEVLLGRNEKIQICWLVKHEIQWFELKKDQFPKYAWRDARTSMQLVRHYGNTALTRLEFIKIAMACLVQRSGDGIQWEYAGDLSYVLMGFLRIRPPIDKYDSSLQAFARLVDLTYRNSRLSLTSRSGFRCLRTTID